GGRDIRTRLSALQPNPFSKLINISFSIEHSAQSIELDIFDIAGRLVKSFHSMPNSPGSWQITWNGSDNTGRALAAGVYFMKFRADDYTQVEKVILLR
ncbi:hypothetical protein AMJ87_12435, partial [candidate division WOR_3 bacterium SM23_60]